MIASVTAVFLLAQFLWATLAFAAGNESVTPLPATQPNAASYSAQRTWDQQEIPAIFSRYVTAGWVYSGGVHASSGSMISAAFATEAFTTSGNRVTADGAGGSASINYTNAGCAGTDTAWVIISAISGNVTANFTRAGTSNYFVDCTSASQPTLPADSAWLMQVTITGSALTTVTPMRFRDPFGAQLQVHVVSRWVTGGDGSAGSPWTGWDTALAWQPDTSYIFPAGTYSYATAPNWAHNNARYLALGEVVLKHTGSGVAVKFDGAPTSTTCDATNCKNAIVFEGFTVDGNAATTDGVYVRGVHHSTFRNIRVKNAASAGFRCEWCVVDLIENLRVSVNEGNFTTKPQYGIFLDKHACCSGSNSTQNTFINPIIEGLNGGTGDGLNCKQGDTNTVLGGTFEGNTNGLILQQNCGSTRLTNAHTEANTALNLSVAGPFTQVIGFQASGNPSGGDVAVQSTAYNTQFIGGAYSSTTTNFSLAAGSQGTILRDLAYAGAISDLGSYTQRDNIWNIPASAHDPFRIKRNTNGTNAGNLILEGNGSRTITHGLNDLLGTDGKAYVDAFKGATPIPIQLNPSNGGVEWGTNGARILSVLEGSNLGVDVANILNGAQTQLNVTVTGAALKDYAMCSASVNPGAVGLTAWVTAADTVTITFINNSGAGVNPPAADYRCLVFHRP